MVVVVTALLQVDAHLARNCPDCRRLPSSGSTSHNQCQQQPLVLADVLVCLAGRLFGEVVEEAIGFLADLVFVLKEGAEPVAYLVTGFGVEQLTGFIGRILATPQRTHTANQIFLQQSLGNPAGQGHCLLDEGEQFRQFGALLEYCIDVLRFCERVDGVFFG